TLEDLIKRKPASLETLRDIAIQMCDGLQYAHSQGVLHGSLSANDVVFAYDDTGRPIVKIQNFGTVKLLSVASHLSDLTGNGVLLERDMVRNFSVEQLLGRGVDERTDV